MNKTSLSLCLFGAALATANILIIQRPTCPSGGTEVAAADKDAPSTQTEVISTVKRKPPQAAKAAVSTAEAKPPDASAQAKPSQALKAAAKPSGPAPKDDVTGSVKQTAKTQEPNDEKSAVSPAQLAKSGLGPARVEDALEEWAEVSLAARVHNAPSVSAPTVRFYRVGTRLKVIGREPGWIKVIDPSTSKEGWIYEKYLTPKEGPDQKQAGLPTITTASSGGYARRHERLGTPSARALCTILQATQWMEVVPGLSATYRIRVQGVPQLVSSRVTKSQVVKAPRSLSLSGG